jgi:hypothetical protein
MDNIFSVNLLALSQHIGVYYETINYINIFEL